MRRVSAESPLRPTGELPRLSPREQARKQLLTIFPFGFAIGEWVELRCLDCSVEPARPGPRHYYRSITALVEQALAYRSQWDVFFGIGLRRCVAAHDLSRCPHDKRGVDHVSRLSVAWGDFDVRSDDEPNKPHQSVDEIVRALTGGVPAPCMLVGSGVGVHGYWSLANPTTELARVERINRSIRERYQGDNAIDAARILRVAGTLNHKHGHPLPVTLLWCDDE